MENDEGYRCWHCGTICSHPGSLATHLRACDLKGQRERHEQRTMEAIAQQKADALAAQVEQDSSADKDTELGCAKDPEPEERVLEQEIVSLLAEQGKRARLERAALACTSWREHLFTPDSHVTQIKNDITSYCESGVDLAAKRMAARFDVDEQDAKQELSECFLDFKELGGTKKETRIADGLMDPIQPACHMRVLGTRCDDKGKMVEVLLAHSLCTLLHTSLVHLFL